ncbi:hypothetical protein CFOL_v3_21386 [Cephalotus follicularis]|uniref:Uncharacterized protein n=1 Tax=Cephalotus follicularis TaxID=3775 RepID=A0A1Q3CCS0_CEPFO|nr:hypothetical protein CFOL_v3_21386 [Cephalotus follicularis]
MTSHWVHPTSNKCGEDQISERFPAPKVNHSRIKGNLNSEVGELPKTRGLRFKKQRSESIEEELEDNPDGFCDNIRDKMSFGVSWDVHVNAIYSLEAVVLKVILLESDRHGYTNREICKNPKPTVVDGS